MKIHSVRLLVLSAFLALMPFTQASALNVQLLHPTTGHMKGYQVRSSETLPQGFLAGGIGFNYAHHPLTIKSTLPGLPNTGNVVSHFATSDLLLSYGVLKNVTLSADVPIDLHHNVLGTAVSTADEGGGKLGDIYFEAKIRVLDIDAGTPQFGLAIIPFISVPSGKESIFFGDNSAKGGAMLAGDVQLGAHRIYANVGTRFKKSETIGSLTVNDEFIYGLGYQVDVAKEQGWGLIGELHGATNYHDFAVEDISSPMEFLGVVQKKWLKDQSLITNIGGGAALTNGYGEPRYRIMAGISYGGSLLNKKPRKPFNLSEHINFDSDKDTIKSDSFSKLNNVAEEIKAHKKEMSAVSIEGHTDSNGGDVYNQGLSERRANAVKRYLSGKGIESGFMQTKGYGEKNPIADNNTEEGRYQNRRTEFKAVK
jgi:outer membrane protein OmpA-like peptidoglycan-associated protein